jgi:hypothetical protein
MIIKQGDMLKSTIIRIGAAVIAIGSEVAIIDSIGCANAGFTGANAFEFIKFIAICLAGGLLCWLGGAIISLNHAIK